MTTADELNVLRTRVTEYTKETSSDVFLFSGSIYNPQSDVFRRMVLEKKDRRQNASLFLTTYGGDPHQAFKMIRVLKGRYEKVRLVVPGPCKSSGTLIAVGCHELAMGSLGELGPLDIQISKPDEVFQFSSGLDAFQALAVVTTEAFSSWEEFMLRIVKSSGGSISTKTACEVASKLATDLFGPIAAQVDPMRLGELQRRLGIANHYGTRIGSENLKPGALHELIHGYPEHGVVIDIEEAREIFKTVTELSDLENGLVSGILSPIMETPQLPDARVLDLEGVLDREQDGNGKEGDASDGGDDDLGPTPPASVGENRSAEGTRDEPENAEHETEGDVVPIQDSGISA